MFQNPRRGRQAKNFYKKCSDNSRSQTVFRTDIFRKLTLGALISRRHHWFTQEMTFGGESPYWWRVTTQIWEVLLIRWSRFSPIRRTTQIWVVTRNQCGIAPIVSPTLLRGETSPDHTKRFVAAMVASHNASCFFRLTDSEQAQFSDALIMQLMFFYQSTKLGD